jgi:hypothetical protein
MLRVFRMACNQPLTQFEGWEYYVLDSLLHGVRGLRSDQLLGTHAFVISHQAPILSPTGPPKRIRSRLWPRRAL